MQLRPDQQKLSGEIDADWEAGRKVVLAVAPTGFGKTVLFSDKVRNADVPTVVIAHRQELVAQMSLTLGRNEVEHRVIASDKTRQVIERLHMKHLGRRWINPRAPHAAAGIDTLIRVPDGDAYLASVRFWVGDEGHHFLKANKWGRGVAKLGPQSISEQARGLLVTATPGRADGKGLGSHADGLADSMVLGPPMRHVINAGNLTDYKLHAPPPSGREINYAELPIGSGGDYQEKPMIDAVKKSSIVGDVVQSYLRIAPGQRGITFAVDLEHARTLAQAYRDAGVPAEVLSSENDPIYRAEVMRRFAEGIVLQLVNVDILGEGTDVPACSVVSMARPTCSFSVYGQQFGRALRLMVSAMLMARWGGMTPDERKFWISGSEKPVAHVIDHVRNWERHGLPDAPRRWSLDRRERASRSSAPDDAIPLRTCLHKNEETELICTAVYERTLGTCPECGHSPTPSGRSMPEEVDGDVLELDPAFLARLRGEAESLVDPAETPSFLSGVAALGFQKNHRERKYAQIELADVIALWGGWQNSLGRDDHEAYKRFYFRYGIDVATARTLGRADAQALANRVRDELISNNVVSSSYIGG
jgi:DNA repair protein RadD